MLIWLTCRLKVLEDSSAPLSIALSLSLSLYCPLSLLPLLPLSVYCPPPIAPVIGIWPVKAKQECRPVHCRGIR